MVAFVSHTTRDFFSLSFASIKVKEAWGTINVVPTLADWSRAGRRGSHLSSNPHVVLYTGDPSPLLESSRTRLFLPSIRHYTLLLSRAPSSRSPFPTRLNDFILFWITNTGPKGPLTMNTQPVSCVRQFSNGELPLAEPDARERGKNESANPSPLYLSFSSSAVFLLLPAPLVIPLGVRGSC